MKEHIVSLLMAVFWSSQPVAGKMGLEVVIFTFPASEEIDGVGQEIWGLGSILKHGMDSRAFPQMVKRFIFRVVDQVG